MTRLYLLDTDISAYLLNRCFPQVTAIHFSQIKQLLTSQGRLVGTMDMLIASCVLTAGGVLVTNNVDEFSRIPSLEIDNRVV